MDLVILAAGMGSRYGGLKQIESIDKYGNFIIDYSIYDAKKAGFDRVIFIIKEENYQIFKDTIGKRVEDKIETHYVFQSLSLLPEGYTLPNDRVKPLGTAQAILATKDIVSDKFVIINADDYYGSDAFKVAADFLNSLKPNTTNQYANIAYEVINTITENGSVKRGVLSVDKDDKLIHLLESKIEKVGEKIIASPLDGATPFKITPSTLVSMNMFCFTHDILDHIEKNFGPYLDKNKDNLLTCEYLIPILTEELVSRSEVEVKVLPTSSVWYGITYKEDKPKVVDSLAKLMDKGEYPEGLWSK